MRPFHQLDLNALKAFYFAARELHFTRAAELAGLTQSGVSQHIRKLEEELGSPLFLRQQKRVILTDAGRELQRFAEAYLDSVEGLFDRLKTHGATLKGEVRYAMPESCLFTPHFPLILQHRMKHLDQVHLEVRIESSEAVVESILANEVDFGFITRNLSNKDLDLKEFAREEYVLVSSSKASVNFDSAKDLRDLPFVSYPGMDSLFEYWFEHEFPRATQLRLDEFSIAGEVNQLRAAISMAVAGLGAAVFPRHCVEPEISTKKLFVRASRSGPATNPIYLITRNDVVQPARVRAVIDAFLDMKKKSS